jgi:hypothetical protein
MIVGAKLWKKNILPLWTTKLGILFLHTLRKTLLTVNGYIAFRKMQMGQWTGTRHAWLQKVLSKGMASTMKIPSVQLLKQPLSDLFCQLLFPGARVYDS